MLNTKSVHKLGLCPTCNQLDQIGGGETSNQPLVGERIKSDWSKPSTAKKQLKISSNPVNAKNNYFSFYFKIIKIIN